MEQGWTKNLHHLRRRVSGAVILGSVDGNRIWGKEVKNTQLLHVQWSPNGKFLLFGTGTGELQLFDNQGVFVSKLSNYCDPHGNSKLAALDWYDGSRGYIEQNIPCLAICYENGKLQIMRDDKDTKPALIDTNMRSIKIKWNATGSVLAVSGLQLIRNSQGEEKEACVVQFWSPMGQFLRSLKVPGTCITSISWEYDGLRIALAVDSFIYFANTRPDYKWSFFAHDVVVYAYHKPEMFESTVVFWNTKTNDRHTRNIKKLLMITSANDHCLIVSGSDDGSQQSVLTVYNAIGIPIETKCIDFEPKFASVSKTHVFIASADIILHWQFKALAISKISALDAIRRKDICERAFHIDDIHIVGSGGNGTAIQDLRERPIILQVIPTKDCITCIASSDSVLMVVRQSGVLYQYSVPSVTLDNKYTLNFHPVSIALNSNSTRVSLLDATGILKLFDLEKRAGAAGNIIDTVSATMVASTQDASNAATISAGSMINNGQLLEFERKDVWDVRWASDDPEQFAIMEKTRLYVFRNMDPESPINCSGYICDFRDMQVKTISLDDIMKDTDSIVKDAVVHIETKALRELRTILSQNGVLNAVQFVDDRPHPRLWKIVAEAALEILDFAQAQKAFIRCQDYQGLQFIKSLKKFDDPAKQKAEIAAYCNQFETAEKIGAVDATINFLKKHGIILVIITTTSSDGLKLLLIILKEKTIVVWQNAITFWRDYASLEKIAIGLSENNALLKSIANKFVLVGLCDQAVAIYVKIGEIASAVNTCVMLNQWNTAVQLAEIHNFKEIDSVLAKYAAYLLSQNRKWEAVELYRKANYCQKSARLLFELAKDAIESEQTVMQIKKIYVLAALEVERYHSISKANRGMHHETATAALDGLLAEDSATMGDHKFLDNAWHGAEAYHFYILAQRQFYNGDRESALVTALHLREYEDIIDAKVIFSLIALISFHSKRYNTCSKAFVKLEALEASSLEAEKSFESLALDIFTKYKPIDPKGITVSCTNCMNKIKDRYKLEVILLALIVILHFQRALCLADQLLNRFISCATYASTGQWSMRSAEWFAAHFAILVFNG
ncbi:WD repeat-containing protein 35 [Batrachochytrium dendrobatidis JEL423]|uniref:WD repeat-containing protein 35 n=1 Tax=Batrachochytrium dendrobatidis (strain JEL423) TaxID=403673 RepID=A0A177WNM5_BATDL|nr:WD repeat-containing protein 35 [Batrachochytrium dendrobatidis JEL423]